MNKAILYLLFIMVFAHPILGQTEITETEKLATTAKIWGFLKYYHPQVAEGKFDWDQQLFKILPKVKMASTPAELSQVYYEWIESLGEVKACKKCVTKDSVQYFDKNFDLSWLNNRELFTLKLSEKLEYIETNRHQGKKKYVSNAQGTGRIEVTNEVVYDDFDWKNKDLRLLTLFRYWNLIEYFYPYKYQTDTQWNKVLNLMIPRFLNPKSEIDFHLAMLELVVHLDDSHAGLTTEQLKLYFGEYWVPVKFKMIDEKIILTGFYNDSIAKVNDLRLGDIITKVDDQDVEIIFQQRKKYLTGSNTPRKRLSSYFCIFNGSTDSVKIEMVRDGKTSIKTIKRYLFKDFNYEWKDTAEKFKIIEGNIGLIHMGVVTVEDVSDIMEALKNTRAIIFDIRNYPKNTLYAFSNYITSKRKDFFKITRPYLDYPGKFLWDRGSQSGNNILGYEGRIILLVNEYSQSHSEFTAMCLQAGDDVTTIGSQTSGADGNVSRILLVGGHKTLITGIGIFYPDGTETQRKGVKIDIEIKPTIDGLVKGKDEILERAIKLIDE